MLPSRSITANCIRYPLIIGPIVKKTKAGRGVDTETGSSLSFEAIDIYILYSVTVKSPPLLRPQTSGKYISSAWAGSTRYSPGRLARTWKVYS